MRYLVVVEKGPTSFGAYVQVLARTTQTVRIEGRRLDGPGTLKFRKRLNDPITDVLVLENPAAASVIPAGATPEVMKAYSSFPRECSIQARGAGTTQFALVTSTCG
jgi:hypothetical protein